MNREQTSTVTSPSPRPPATVPAVSASPSALAAPCFVPPRLTKLGKVADLTAGGLGGSGLGGDLEWP